MRRLFSIRVMRLLQTLPTLALILACGGKLDQGDSSAQPSGPRGEQSTDERRAAMDEMATQAREGPAPEGAGGQTVTGAGGVPTTQQGGPSPAPAGPSPSPTSPTLGGPPLPSTPPPVPDQEVMTVPALTVAPGENREITASRIVSQSGIRIDGNLTLSLPPGSRSNTIWVVAQTGNIEINGTVMVRDSSQAPSTPPTGLKIQRKVPNLRALLANLFHKIFPYAEAQTPTAMTRPARREEVERIIQTIIPPQPGRKASGLMWEAPTGDLILGPEARVFATSGIMIPLNGRRVITTQDMRTDVGPPTRYLYSGWKAIGGGDLILRAPNGQLVLRYDASGRGPLFGPGSGADAQTLVIDDSQFPLRFDEILIGGQAGGDSGELRIETGGIRFEGRTDAVLETGLLAGRGGRGGNVVWQVSDGRRFEGLRRISLFAGNGGDGRWRGGNGGHVAYFSGRVINSPGELTTEVFVGGGDGGSVPRYTALPPVTTVNRQGDIAQRGGAPATGRSWRGRWRTCHCLWK